MHEPPQRVDACRRADAQRSPSTAKIGCGGDGGEGTVARQIPILPVNEIQTANLMKVLVPLWRRQRPTGQRLRKEDGGRHRV